MTNIRIIATWLKDKGTRGATMVEYVLLVALVALVGAVGWGFVGSAIDKTSENVCDEIAQGNEFPDNELADCDSFLTEPTP